MKFLVKEGEKAFLYCSKKDVIALMASDNPPPADIINIVRGLNEKDYVKFEKMSHILYLNNHPWLISYVTIKKYKNRIQSHIDKLNGYLAYLAYYEDVYKETMDEGTRNRNEQAMQRCQYQIEALETHNGVLEKLPIIPNDNWLDLECNEYAMYGTYFDNLLYIEHKKHKPISLEDQIPLGFINEGVKLAISKNKAYEDITDYNYEIKPDFVENKWFILINPIMKEKSQKKRWKLFKRK